MVIKRKYLGIPTAILIALALLFIMFGSAYAGYTVWDATVVVAVTEPLSVTSSTPGYSNGTWNVSLVQS